MPKAIKKLPVPEEIINEARKILLKKESKKGDSFSLRAELLPNLLIWLKWIIKNPGSAEQTNVPLPLHGPDARARNRFFTMVELRVKETEVLRTEILNKYAKKDKKGEVIMTPSENPMRPEPRHSFTPENEAKAEKELVELFNSLIIFDVLPSNKDDFKAMKDIFLNKLRSEFSTEDSIIYEEICQSFEKLEL